MRIIFFIEIQMIRYVCKKAQKLASFVLFMLHPFKHRIPTAWGLYFKSYENRKFCFVLRFFHLSAIQNAFATPRLEPSSRDHLLQNSCDRILQSHHSVSGAHSVHSYSAHPRHPHPKSNPYHQGSYHRDYWLYIFIPCKWLSLKTILGIFLHPTELNLGNAEHRLFISEPKKLSISYDNYTGKFFILEAASCIHLDVNLKIVMIFSAF